MLPFAYCPLDCANLQAIRYCSLIRFYFIPSINIHLRAELHLFLLLNTNFFIIIQTIFAKYFSIFVVHRSNVHL